MHNTHLTICDGKHVTIRMRTITQTAHLAICGDEQVVWLDVPVDNAEVVHLGQAHQHLAQDGLDDLRGCTSKM